ncbi:MAG: ABC transporter permease [Candidatus Aminicenantes bacterium]|nr:ABC transporter permease [Candidatus Aminicenantes bacterium]
MKKLPSSSRPRLARWAFERIARSEEKRTLVGDADELYFELLKERGPLRAGAWYWGQILVSLPRFFLSGFYWRTLMLKNAYLMAWRNMKKSKLFSFINVVGLAAGMAAAILILLWVHDELGFDRFHAKADRLYRAVTEQRDIGAFDHYAVTPRAMGQTLKDEVPEVVRASRFMGAGIRLDHDGLAVAESGAFVDPDFLQMFSFPLLQGNPDSALEEPLSIVITEMLAWKYFRGENPVGQTLTTMNKTAFQVTGVIRDVPARSHLRFDFLVPFRLFEDRLPAENAWDDVSYFTYVELGDRASLVGLEDKITAVVRTRKSDAAKTEYRLQALGRVHLYSDFKFDFPGHGDITQVMIFSAVALFILVIACLNFVGLSTARSSSRSKEVGVRKAAGAGRNELARQFFGESVFMTSLAFVLALGAVKIILPSFSAFAGRTFHLTFGSGIQIWLGLLAIVVFVGVMSGAYPALFLSAFPAVSALKGGLRTGARKGGFRRAMVVLQFTISVFLVISTLVVSRQVRYLRNRPLGYDPDHLIFVSLEGGIARNAQAVKTEFLRNPAILGACLLDNLPIYEGSGTSGSTWDGKPEDLKVQMRLGFADEDYLETFRMELAEGRFFGAAGPSDSPDGLEDFVLNESAVRAMGLQDPVGKRFSVWDGRPGRIIGVVRDFQLRSSRYPIEPLILANDPGSFGTLCLRIKSDHVPETIKSLETTWKTFSPEFPFRATFYDQAVDELYRNERRSGTLYQAMTSMAVVIACLGLFGLASYLAEQRTKEIGIRKVLGASVPGIFVLVSREFLQWVAVANLLAWPAAFVFLRSWLQNFAYRTPLGIDVFALSAGLSLAIALLTVGGQALRVARTVPARSLRYE